MAKKISGSVGKGGKNDSKDVLVVQQLMSWHKGWVHPHVIKPTGKYDKILGEAIALFQKKACSLSKPDGRVDPNGFTLSRLNITRIPQPKHPIFNVCFNVNTSKLTDADYSKVATLLSCEIEAIKSVAEVETKMGAWDSMGRPTILFERHYFRDLTLGKYTPTHPDISGSPGGYGRFSQQYPKLYRAAVLNEKAALKSASWGSFQIMGKNYKQAGYATIFDFVKGLMSGEKENLDAFGTFIKNDKNLLDAIQNKKWKKFARYYNGKGYAKNQYDTKMDSEYKKLKAITAAKKSNNKSTLGVLP